MQLGTFREAGGVLAPFAAEIVPGEVEGALVLGGEGGEEKGE